ncbi:Type II secretion system protein F [Gimesia panareensis]|uniref:Type II secretion system protein F n=1 Tax=Gimesia panareensis TaxID=2527978 RepID=A0A517QFW4_9PLAN|nr:type II secretion system F family protein [Gimesia panareensis]QDT30465.1 Type II secretion system protein F [Gimesia panareensis]
MTGLNKMDIQNVSAESLADLNDELSAMVRSGIPLDEGLRNAAKYLKKDSQSLIEQLIQKIEQGASLDAALESEAVRLPASYVALVKSGLQMGRLPEALTTFTSFSRARMELRREIGAALLYPAFVLFVAFLLSLFMCFIIFPELVTVDEIFQLKNTFLMNSFMKIIEFYQTWYLLIPLIFLLLIFSWNYSRHSFMMSREQNQSLSGALFTCLAYGWIPGYRKLIQDMNLSTFSEMAGVLLSYRVPLTDSLVLAAESTGNPKLINQFQRVAEKLEQGASLDISFQSAGQLPDYVKSMMVNPAHQNQLPGIMSEMARVYRTRVLNRMEWIKHILPVALVVLVAGGITICYALIVFLPFVEILKMLGSPSL